MLEFLVLVGMEDYRIMVHRLREHGELQGDKPWPPEFPFDDEPIDEPEINGGLD